MNNLEFDKDLFKAESDDELLDIIKNENKLWVDSYREQAKLTLEFRKKEKS